MKNHLFSRARLLVCACVLSAPVWSFAQPTSAPVETDDVKLHVSNDTEYQSLFDAVKMEPQQEAAVREKIAERTRILAAWVESSKGKELVALRTELAEVRNAKQADKIGPIREKIKPLADEYMATRVSTRAAILKELTPAQQTTYAASRLYERVAPGPKVTTLSEAQVATIRAMTEAKAGEYLASTPIEKDVYFRGFDTMVAPMKKTIFETVLTDEQRTSIEARRLPKPATTQSAM